MFIYISNMEFFYQKYLKYKNKYLTLKNQIGGVNKEQLRDFIKNEFTNKLIIDNKCDLTSRTCRGTSFSLYKLMIKSDKTPQYMKIDNDHFQIVNGLGHTFIRYNNGTNEKPEYIYIDPTIEQFHIKKVIPDFDGIFIGDEADLREIAKKQINMTGYKN